jgi:hypothetical protein
MFLSIACALALLLSCHPAERTVTPIDNPSLPARGFFMGVLPMPGAGQSFDSVFRQAARYSEFVPVWGKPSPFYEMAADLRGSWGTSFVSDYTRGSGMFPIVHLSFMAEGMTLSTPPGMTGATLSTPAWREAYLHAALDVLRAVKPRYLSLGNEVNRWYEKYGAADTNPNGFQNFVNLYEEAYDSVKQLSPETKVFCVFAREIVDENRGADLEVLSRFNPDKLDLLAFTSYPFAVQATNRPDSIPDDYYSRALTIMPGKPFGLIEIGWTDADFFGGEQGQADFLTQAAGRLTRSQGVNLSLLGWAWLHDLDTSDHAGLIHSDGTEKQAYQVWKTLSGR